MLQWDKGLKLNTVLLYYTVTISPIHHSQSFRCAISYQTDHPVTVFDLPPADNSSYTSCQTVIFCMDRDVVLGTRTRTRQMRWKLPDADVSASSWNPIWVVCDTCILTLTRANCICVITNWLSRCKHETISRVWVLNSVSHVLDKNDLCMTCN